MKVKIKGINHGRATSTLLDDISRVGGCLTYVGFGDLNPGCNYKLGDYRIQDNAMVVYDGNQWCTIEAQPQPTTSAPQEDWINTWAASAGIDLDAIYDEDFKEDSKIQVAVPNSYFGDGTRKATVSGLAPVVKTPRGMTRVFSAMDEAAFRNLRDPVIISNQEQLVNLFGQSEGTLTRNLAATLGMNEASLTSGVAWSSAEHAMRHEGLFVSWADCLKPRTDTKPIFADLVYGTMFTRVPIMPCANVVNLSGI